MKEILTINLTFNLTETQSENITEIEDYYSDLLVMDSLESRELVQKYLYEVAKKAVETEITEYAAICRRLSEKME